MNPARFDAAIALALGHDQSASSCPWVQLTRSTTDYPSRKATAALALLNGALTPQADIVDLMFRCDGCCRCQATAEMWSTSALAELIFEARALLAGKGLAAVADQAATNWRQFGNVYGELSEIEPGPASRQGNALFVPGAATLFHDPAASRSAWSLIQRCIPVCDRTTEILDSGFVLMDLGLTALYEMERRRVRDFIAREGYKTVIAGTPKEAFDLSVVLDGLGVIVTNAVSVMATALGSARLSSCPPPVDGSFVLNPSGCMLCDSNDLEQIELALTRWLGCAFRRQAPGGAPAWPAAVERPSTEGNLVLETRFAELRAEQLLASTGPGSLTVLTVDSFSHAALTRSLGGRAEVVDLMRLVERYLERDEQDA